MRLIELTQKYESLLYKLEHDEDFQLESELDQTEELLESKLESCAWMMRNLELEAEAYKAEAKRLADKQKSRERAAERLKKYIAFCLREQPLKTKNFSFSFRKSEAVEILDEAALPEEYLRVKTEVNKELIKQKLKNGIQIEGAALLTNLSLQIK